MYVLFFSQLMCHSICTVGSGMAPRPVQERKDTGTRIGLEEVVHSVNNVALVDSPVEEVASPIQVNSPQDDTDTSPSNNDDFPNPPIASPSADDPRNASSPTNPLTKTDTALPALEARRSSSSPKQIYDIISTSPAASACETPCLDKEAHRARYHDEQDGFFPVQEDEHENDPPEDCVAESPGGLSHDGEDFSAMRDGHTGDSPLTTQQQALRDEEQAHVDSMVVAKDSALSHSTEALRARRKRSEGCSPPAPASPVETPREGAATPALGGRGRMLSVDDGMSDVSSAGRGLPGSHHRRTSSTHR